MKKLLNVGIVGCSSIAQRKFLPAISKCSYTNLYIVGSRNIKKAKDLANSYNCSRSGTYDDVITNPDVDLVYISTPISTRFELLKKSILFKRMLFLRNLHS